MAKGTCDHLSAGEPYNEEMLTVSGCTIDVRYTWDGVSTIDSCNGPVLRVRLQNPNDVSAWALVPRRRGGGARWIEIPSGTDRIITGAELAVVGLDVMDALRDVNITLRPQV